MVLNNLKCWYALNPQKKQTKHIFLSRIFCGWKKDRRIFFSNFHFTNYKKNKQTKKKRTNKQNQNETKIKNKQTNFRSQIGVFENLILETCSGKETHRMLFNAQKKTIEEVNFRSWSFGNSQNTGRFLEIKFRTKRTVTEKKPDGKKWYWGNRTKHSENSPNLSPEKKKN